MAGTFVAENIKVGSIKVENKWDIYNRLDKIVFQYNVDKSESCIQATVPLIEFTQPKKLYIPSNCFHVKFRFDASKFSQDYSLYGIKLLHSDSDLRIVIYNNEYLGRDFKYTPFAKFTREDLKKDIHVVLRYDKKPSSVVFSVYPIVGTNDNGASQVETATCGFVSL